MSSTQLINPRQICESLLLQCIELNQAQNLSARENTVAERLLARGDELTDAYKELHNVLSAHHPMALQVFLGQVLISAAFWNQDENKLARSMRDNLDSLNQQIARKAGELAKLLEQRTELHDSSGFISDTHTNVCDVIQAASQNNYLFKTYVQERLEDLQDQFDYKYWPTLTEFMAVLASDAVDVAAAAKHPLTAVATDAVRASKADFFKVLFKAIELCGASRGGLLPEGYRPTDRTVASLANCALGLGPDDLVDEGYVKVLRARGRERD